MINFLSNYSGFFTFIGLVFGFCALLSEGNVEDYDETQAYDDECHDRELSNPGNPASVCYEDDY